VPGRAASAAEDFRKRTQDARGDSASSTPSTASAVADDVRGEDDQVAGDVGH